MLWRVWTDRAIAYRRRLGIAPDQVAIAVVVQRMVDAEAAGVMFTADPVSGHRERIVVDASGGLGEAVVSGRVTPDHYELDRRGALLAWTPGRAEVVIRGAADGGVVEEAGHASGERLLGDAVHAELARLGVAVQERFGRPMDIEWALAGGRVRLVQARPMTALAASPPSPPAVDRARETERRLMSHPRLRRSARRRARIARRIAAVRAANVFREDSHFSFTMPLPVLRRSLLEIGARLRDAGVLAAPEDVFHLRLEEVEAAGDPAALPPARRDELAATVRARAARREELAGEIVRRAVERGEVDASAVTERRLEAGQALLRYHFLFNGTPIPDQVVVEIVDEVLLPLFLPAPAPPPPA